MTDACMLQGETFELDRTHDLGWRAVVEQVCHSYIASLFLAQHTCILTLRVAGVASSARVCPVLGARRVDFLAGIRHEQQISVCVLLVSLAFI